MKPSIIIAILLFAGNAYSTTLQDFSGRWIGKRDEFVNGARYTFSQNTTFRYKGGALLGKGTLATNGMIFRASGAYYADGTYSGSLVYSGTVVAVSSGTWRLVGKTIRLKAVSRTINGTQKANASLQLVSPKRLIAVSNTTGGNISITLRKR